MITDKTKAHTQREDVLERLFGEIASEWDSTLAGRLMLGHGSGSFGHIPAHEHGTRRGVSTPSEWQGFTEVWREARALNQLVCEAAYVKALPVLAFPPSAGVIAEAGQIVSWPVEPIQSALRVGLLPILFGDVVFDRQWGGTIQSTEELFIYLAHQLSPRRILLAGLEEGVWADFPHKKHLIPCIHPGNFDELQPRIMGSSATDVTGGMLAKVTSMLALVQQIPNLEVLIFSGLKPGCLSRALRGENPGTLICNTQGDKR